MDGLRERLAELLAADLPSLPELPKRELVVYGAGNCGRKVASTAAAEGLKVRAFLDARADGIRSCDGIACFCPNSAEARGLAESRLPAVIGIFNHTTDLRPIRAMLQQIGFERVISYFEFHQQYCDAPDFWLGDRQFYRERAPEILAGFDLLGDWTSREIFYHTIAFRLSFDLELLSEPDSANQYLPGDLPPPASPMRLIDGGAFTGDTLSLFLERGITFTAVAAFEPEHANYRQLRSVVGMSLDRLGEAMIMPCGLDRETTLRSFHSGAGAASGMGDAGMSRIQVVALDDVLPSFAPTFIKLDIEGAEPMALQGAATTIRQFTPRLAVCVYHLPDHLWTIPQLIREMAPGYQLALRYHQWSGFDTVAYAYTP